MSKQYDLTGFAATEEQKAFILTFTGLSGDVLSVEVPADNFLGVFPRLQQLWLAAMQWKQGGERWKRGTWEKTPMVEAISVHVENLPMESKPAVAIVFDHGTATQIGYRMTPEKAKELVAKLLEKAALSNHQAPEH